MKKLKTFEMYFSNKEELDNFDFSLGDDIIYSKKEELNDYAKLLKENGIDILVPKEPTNWFYFTKDDKIAMASYDRFDGIAISAVHKPTTNFGTGYRIETTWEPTVDMALKALNTTKPSWDRTKGMPNKYTSLKEFLKKNPDYRLY
jgi:hypothetical protein